MARVAKYLEREQVETENALKYKRSVEHYVIQKKVNSATNAEKIGMIFSKELKNTHLFLQSDNPQFWEDLIRHINDNRKSLDYLNTLKENLICIANVSDTFFIEKDSLKLVYNITQLQNDFIRPIKDWKPKSRNRFKQMHELLRHLFAKFDVPEFLDAGFVKGELESISLFMNIGQGKSFKDFEFTPNITLNKKTYHHLLSTPADYTFFEAFRRAQILSIGGSEKLVHNILGSKLKTLQRNQEDFWITVIQFFIAQPMFDYDHVGPIIDYIANKKYATRFENGRNLPPEQPGFSIKGRTIQALLRQTEEWHDRLAIIARQQEIIARQNRRNQTYTYTPRPTVTSWAKFRLPNFHYKNNEKAYNIIQYSSTSELMQEGADMRHCVGSYAYSCSTGGTSIWSLRVTEKGEMKKLLTIELNNRTSQIVQIRGRGNRKAEVSEMNIVNRWAMDQGLQVSKYI